ncbi:MULTISPECIES: dihydroneopterin aldolase [unclassified Luteococcus]|uniref:dihydroneopterin aldolase n=1 Tax=unclassified Luteococcus TaxID=2639923 RepID=UPI00313E5BBB
MEELDWISVHGLQATGFHGVYPEERRDGQTFVVDLDLGLHAVTDTDRLADTVDYSVVSADVVDIITGDPVDLIETLAGRIAQRCLAEPQVRVATVRVHKPTAPMGFTFTDVSVSITRSKS